MSVILDALRLDYEMAIRGLNGSVLARLAGVCPATVCTARAGKAISTASLQLIADAVAAVPVDPAIVRLLAEPRVLGIDPAPTPTAGDA
jgi:hypothetical protein